ncbi:MAG: hypothetical protein WC886_07540 [Saccharofermentanaceae bacterium]|jgi:hypothetical protein
MENLKIKVKDIEVGDMFWAEIPFKVIKKTKNKNTISIVSEERHTKCKYIFEAIPDFEVKSTRMGKEEKIHEITAEEYIKINSTSNGMIDSRNALMALEIERCKDLSLAEKKVFLKYGIKRN